ncbi:MAG: hypothetical protein KGL11_01905 [Alphaproteobacteria bacterium]|nr:hypothetical protein [Alphaproteobacteria bacterium]
MSAGGGLRRALAAAVALLIAGSTAQANPPPGADLRYHDWFAQLKSKDGISCCDTADCRYVAERIVGDRYEVRFHEADPVFPSGWVAVPDDAVRPRPPGADRKRPSPAGSTSGSTASSASPRARP